MSPPTSRPAASTSRPFHDTVPAPLNASRGVPAQQRTVTTTDIHAPAASKAVVEYLASKTKLRPVWEAPLAERRAELKQQMLEDSGAAEPIDFVRDVDAGGVAARLYQPKKDAQPGALVWFHGGGWTLHDLESFDPLMRALARAANCAVLSVDYRLAPEHRYPAAVHDAQAATRWATKEFDAVAVGGDSAGATLATVAALTHRATVALQVLVYPVTDYRVDDDSYHQFRRRYENFAGVNGYGTLRHETLRWLWSQYVPSAHQRANPDVSPLRAPSLEGAPPALIVTATHDILQPEALEYATRLREHHVPVVTHNYNHQIHGFLEALAVFPEARDAVTRIAGAVRQRLQGNASMDRDGR